MRDCSNCNLTTPGGATEGKKVLSCHIDTRDNAYNNTNDMARSNMSLKRMKCGRCQVNDEGTADDEGAGTDHTVTEFFTELPEVLLVSVKRFTNSTHGGKLNTSVNPSNMILLESDGQEQVFYLKSIDP